MLGKSLVGAIAVAAALWLAVDAASAFADSKYPNLKGQWVRARIPVPGGGQAPFDPTKPVGRGQQAPLTPEYQKIFEANLAEQATGGQGNWQGGRCLPVGPSRAFTAPMPFQVVQGPKMIAFLFEYQTIYRMVYMDGRPHPDEIMDYPEFMGHSIGHWEGDTLVIDTVGINERSWLDTAGHEHSARLHLIERLQKLDDSHVKWTVTYDDPVFFTQPWSITRTFTRGKPADRIMAYSCDENNRDIEHLRTGTNKKAP